MLKTEARRLFARYKSEVVTHYNFCPFARQHQSWPQKVVVTEDTIAEAIAQLPAAADQLVLLILPRCHLDYQQFTQRVSAAAQTLRHFALAAFHPQPPPVDSGSAHRLVPTLRRTPDPTIQCTPSQWLESMTTGTSFASGSLQEMLRATAKVSTTERIAADNYATYGNNSDAVTSAIAAIIADRNRAYAAIDASLPQW